MEFIIRKYERLANGKDYFAVIRTDGIFPGSTEYGCVPDWGKCHEWIKNRGEYSQPKTCPICKRQSKSGGWYANSHGKGMVCFDCRDA